MEDAMQNLPQIPDSQKQEEKSIAKFKALFNENKFLIRDERNVDYGVDLRLELISDQRNATNITIDVQIKSVKNGKYKTEGCLTFSRIVTNNLNYLLNSPYSIYAVYSEHEDLFFWDYCMNIKKYCKSRSIDLSITDQKSITYHFKKILNNESIDEIYNEIKFRYNDILQRADINQLLTKRSSNNTDINISQDPVKTKKALEYYIDLISKKDCICDLMQITLYNYSEIEAAKANGILTSRLASGLISVIDADLSVLMGEKDLILNNYERNFSIAISSIDKFTKLIQESTSLDDFHNRISQKCITFDNYDSFKERMNNALRYTYMKKLNILNKLSRSEYESLISINANSRSGLSYKTVTQLYNYRFNDNYIENTDASFYNRYFILDFEKKTIIDGKECTNDIYEVDLSTFYNLISEICSAKQDIEDNINVEDANKYLVHMNGIVSELISIYNQSKVNTP